MPSPGFEPEPYDVAVSVTNYCTEWVADPLLDANTKRKRYGKNSKLKTAALIVRVQYFVRGGFVGHRSRESSKHLSPLIFRSTGFDSSGVKKGLRCSCKMHVWVSGPTKTPTAVGVRSSEVTPS
ncbi:hypothetical protein TNCV_3285261 [Trichonephila clavipes]|nr:hypothetical protein TNCV_3285261 [Trichonephila clavipes]